jgi:hypothetical protein
VPGIATRRQFLQMVDSRSGKSPRPYTTCVTARSLSFPKRYHERGGRTKLEAARFWVLLAPRMRPAAGNEFEGRAGKPPKTPTNSDGGSLRSPHNKKVVDLGSFRTPAPRPELAHRSAFCVSHAASH